MFISKNIFQENLFFDFFHDHQNFFGPRPSVSFCFYSFLLTSTKVYNPNIEVSEIQDAILGYFRFSTKHFRFFDFSSFSLFSVFSFFSFFDFQFSKKSKNLKFIENVRENVHLKKYFLKKKRKYFLKNIFSCQPKIFFRRCCAGKITGKTSSNRRNTTETPSPNSECLSCRRTIG